MWHTLFGCIAAIAGCADAAYCYRQSSVVRLSVCLSGGQVLAKTAEPIGMPIVG